MQQIGAETQQRLSQLANQLKQDQAELADARSAIDEECLAEGRQAVAAAIQAVENLEATLPKG